MNPIQRLCAAVATAALLTACGGGSDPAPVPETPANTVPDSATASVRAYTDYTAALIADTAASETAEPLQLNAAAAPLSETASPLPVD